MGHYCRICGRTRANEKFSGKGHKIHVCKTCMQMPVEQRRHIEETQEICGFLAQSHIYNKNLARLEVLTASPDEEIARMARIVLEIGTVRPYKKKRSRFLIRERRDLFVALCETGRGPWQLYDYDPYTGDPHTIYQPIAACWNCGTLYSPAETGRCGECGFGYEEFLAATH